MDERGWRVNSVVTVANHLTTTDSVKVHRAVGFSGPISYRIARLYRLHPRGEPSRYGALIIEQLERDPSINGRP